MDLQLARHRCNRWRPCLHSGPDRSGSFRGVAHAPIRSRSPENIPVPQPQSGSGTDPAATEATPTPDPSAAPTPGTEPAETSESPAENVDRRRSCPPRHRIPRAQPRTDAAAARHHRPGAVGCPTERADRALDAARQPDPRPRAPLILSDRRESKDPQVLRGPGVGGEIPLIPSAVEGSWCPRARSLDGAEPSSAGLEGPWCAVERRRMCRVSTALRGPRKTALSKSRGTGRGHLRWDEAAGASLLPRTGSKAQVGRAVMYRRGAPADGLRRARCAQGQDPNLRPR